MKHLTAVIVLLMLVVPCVALEEGPSEYKGGSIVQLKPGATGEFVLTQESTFIFQSAAGKLTVPYDSITKYSHRSEVKHRLGVLPTIAVGLVAARKHRDFLELEFCDSSGAPQAALFEITGSTWKVLQPVLDARVPKPKKADPQPARTPAVGASIAGTEK